MPEDDSKPQPAGEKPRLKKVTLKNAVKYRGEDKQPGEEIEVRPDQEERLRKHGEI